ncbi:MAG: hypothetical protein JNK87_19900 [Bryobacterales bacterium]|nr:hypothetical protein [Bryobacterales bacterium]
MLLSRVALGCVLLCGLVWAQAPKPVDKKAILEALQIGGLTQNELVNFVRQRGVEFQPTPADEAQLKKAGASLALVSAIKNSYRGASASAPASTPRVTSTKPLTKPELLTLLQAQTPAERITAIARDRGLDFRITPDVQGQLQAAGAGPDLVDSLVRLQPNHAPVALPPKKVMGRALLPEGSATAGAPEALPAVAASAPEPVTGGVMPAKLEKASIHSLRDVKKLFVEPLPGGLDAALRSEIGRQMGKRLALAGSREEADAVLGGVGALSIVDTSGTRVLWAEDSKGKSAIASVKPGSAQAVAEKLVGRMKKAFPN